MDGFTVSLKALLESRGTVVLSARPIVVIDIDGQVWKERPPNGHDTEKLMTATKSKQLTLGYVWA